MSPRSLDAIIIGGGCAGFAAATALVESGARVLVLEARPGLGGRATAFTDPATGERVDNGQHILMGCYAETLAFLDRIGAADRVSWQSGLKLSMIDRRGITACWRCRRCRRRCIFLPGSWRGTRSAGASDCRC
jgi:uncharacterized protein with NAD-binding domain and iron-sulfur cluster